MERRTQAEALWQSTPVIPALRRLKQDNCCEFKANLDYIMSTRLAWATVRHPVSRHQRLERRFYQTAKSDDLNSIKEDPHCSRRALILKSCPLISKQEP